MAEFLIIQAQMRSWVWWLSRKCSAANEWRDRADRSYGTHKGSEGRSTIFLETMKDWGMLSTIFSILSATVDVNWNVCLLCHFLFHNCAHVHMSLCVFWGVSVSRRVLLISMCVTLRYVPSFVSVDYSFPFEVRQLAQRGRSERRLRAGFHTSPAAACHLGGICACRPQRSGVKGKESIERVAKEEESKRVINAKSQKEDMMKQPWRRGVEKPKIWTEQKMGKKAAKGIG